MRKVFSFMMVSTDGFFEGPGHDISWHNTDQEFNVFAADQLKEVGTLLFGRKTYELMASFWPNHRTGEDKGDTVVSEKMNTLPKIVFSKTLESADWGGENKEVRLVKDNVEEEVLKMKHQRGKDLAVLGSNSLSVRLLKAGLLDELRIMVNPVILGKGTSLLEGIRHKLDLKLIKTKVFDSGNVLLYCRPIK